MHGARQRINKLKDFFALILFREIASAIKYLLDAVNNVINHIPLHENKQVRLGG